MSGTQVRNIHRVLHNALNYAVRLGYIASNPTEAINKPREDTEERPVYTPDQVRRFIVAMESDRLQAMWYLVLATGLPKGRTGWLEMARRGAGSGPPGPGCAHDPDYCGPCGGRARSQEPLEPACGSP